jgi:hypothetical protein
MNGRPDTARMFHDPQIAFDLTVLGLVCAAILCLAIETAKLARQGGHRRLSGGTLFYQSRVYPVPSQFNQSEPNVLVDGLLSHLKAIAGEGVILFRL